MNINIGTPCNENWNQMVPNASGKHCDKCNKSVIDLRKKSSEEINNLILENGNSGMCIRANSFQLDDYKYVQPIKRLAFALLIVFGNALFSISANAQEATKKMKETYLNKEQVTSGSVISGTVLDETGEALPFVAIALLKDEVPITGTTTDFDGKYKLNLDESYLNKKYTLKITYVGYESIVIKDLVIKKGIMNNDFTMNGHYELMGDVIFIPNDPPLINKDPAELNKTTIKRKEIQRSASGR